MFADFLREVGPARPVGGRHADIHVNANNGRMIFGDKSKGLRLRWVQMMLELLTKLLRGKLLLDNWQFVFLKLVLRFVVLCG